MGRQSNPKRRTPAGRLDVAPCRHRRRGKVFRNHPASRAYRSLRMTIRQPPVSERPASDLKARTLGAARAIPSPTRGTQAKRAAILLSGALVAAAIIFFWMGGI